MSGRLPSEVYRADLQLHLIPVLRAPVGFSFLYSANPDPFVFAEVVRHLAKIRADRTQFLGALKILDDFELPEGMSVQHRLALILAARHTYPQVEQMAKDATLVFCCHTGNRSQAAAEHFAAKGFTRIFNVIGGIAAWSKEIDPSVPQY